MTNFSSSLVDYIGIGQDLRNAMAIYLQSGGQGSPIVDIKEAIAGMKEKFEIIGQMFNGFDYQAYFKVNTAQKLQVLLGAENFIFRVIRGAGHYHLDYAFI
jgi:type I restriction enzyme R subunit